MTNDRLFDVLRQIIIAVTGVPECILADPNNPAPDGEYCSVQPQQSLKQRGQANINRTAGVLQQSVEIKAQIECRASVNFYRGDSRTRAARLFQCNKRPDVSALLLSNKLGWAGTGAINNLTALQANNWESRSQIDLVLLYETNDVITINSIESAELTVSDMKNGQETGIYNGVLENG